ncbi:hypothetical protein G6F62_012337 [Rhizopus arrhizus]|nr:hypothetical protein G6F23_012573 [Rhizopus arrhizus]KAG0762681.1 hypothetical protein G6F24_006608 [Rhizopus arrhizus]KAG0910085.1 hypothetical protein G6F33_008210 [Rhizopus arrhizus]KAG0945932.1 hypothetical protein G6F32_006758 [Rhizopus arrhizus]KAG1292672.1 hypothetical protein G6F66_006764 [Rhizopus arrhizus]
MGSFCRLSQQKRIGIDNCRQLIHCHRLTHAFPSNHGVVSGSVPCHIRREQFYGAFTTNGFRQDNACIPESDEHFVWSCPLKQAAWQLMSCLTFPSQPIQLQDVMNSPTTASTATAHQSNVDRMTVVACMMLSIWRVHWKVVFHEQRFYHGEVVACTRLMLRRIHRENMLST